MRRQSFGRVSRELSSGSRMGRSVRGTRKYRQKASVSRSSSYGLEWDTTEYMAQAVERMEIYDSLSPVERELVDQYGFTLAYPVCRQHYGRWDEARAILEEKQAALQVANLRSISFTGLVAALLRRQ
jgi:hypothetical protein